MTQHQWLFGVLKDIIAYAAINGMPQVAKHVAIGLQSLDLHVINSEISMLKKASEIAAMDVAEITGFPDPEQADLLKIFPFMTSACRSDIHCDEMFKAWDIDAQMPPNLRDSDEN